MLQMLVKAGHSVSQPSRAMDPLLAATETGRLQLVKWLINHGAPIHSVRFSSISPLLMMSSVFDHYCLSTFLS